MCNHNESTKETFHTRTLSGLLSPSVRVYLHLADEAEQADFMKTAEQEGFTFKDGTMPTAGKADEVMVLNDDRTISYPGFAGSMAFHNSTHIGEKRLLKIDYKSYMSGESYYFCEDMKRDDQELPSRHETASRSIGDGSAAFILYENDIQNNTELFSWLESEGFSFWAHSKGWYAGVCWIYVNLNSKLIARGMPGVAVTAEVGKHAVTIEEFKTIYSIFKKYAGLYPLKFK